MANDRRRQLLAFSVQSAVLAAFFESLRLRWLWAAPAARQRAWFWTCETDNPQQKSPISMLIGLFF